MADIQRIGTPLQVIRFTELMGEYPTSIGSFLMAWLEGGLESVMPDDQLVEFKQFCAANPDPDTVERWTFDGYGIDALRAADPAHAIILCTDDIVFTRRARKLRITILDDVKEPR